MIDKIFDDLGFNSLKKGTDVVWLREKAISQNVANITTPGYDAIDVKFEELLQKQYDFEIEGKMTHPKHIPLGKQGIENVAPEVSRTGEAIPVGGINNVNIDKEMVKLAKNSMDAEVYLSLLALKYKVLTEAIIK